MISYFPITYRIFFYSAFHPVLLIPCILQPVKLIPWYRTVEKKTFVSRPVGEFSFYFEEFNHEVGKEIDKMFIFKKQTTIWRYSSIAMIKCVYFRLPSTCTDRIHFFFNQLPPPVHQLRYDAYLARKANYFSNNCHKKL